MRWQDRILPMREWTTLNGRTNRLNYFILSVVYFSVFFIVVILPWLWPDISYHLLFKSDYSFVFYAYYGFASIILAGLWASITVKRLHDLRLPGIIALAIFAYLPMALMRIILTLSDIMPVGLEAFFDEFQKLVGMINAALFVYLCLTPGEQGINRYGPEPMAMYDVPELNAAEIVNSK